MKVLIFILVSAIITFIIASGVCYSNGYNGKGAIFLAIGVISLIGTYQYYDSLNNKRKRDSSSGYTNYDGCSFIECCQPIHWPTSGDCSLVDQFTNFDCGGADCSGADCSVGDCNGG